MVIKKKGQVTIPIIIGLLLLISIALFFYLRGETVVVESGTIVPDDIAPVYTLVESCIYSISEEAIITLGLQGGYIEIPADIKNNPSTHVKIDPFGLYKIPYWYFKGEKRVPTIGSMENDISTYVESKLESCVGSLKDFEYKFKVKAGTPEVNTIIADKDVYLEVNFPVELKSKVEKKTIKIDKFNSKIPVALRRAYDLANRTIDTEIRDLFFENLTIDLMAAHPDIPFTGMDVSCNPKTWYISSIKEELSSVLYYNIPRMRVENTDYSPFVASKKEYEKLAEYTMEDIYNENYPKEAPPSDFYEYFHFFLDVGSIYDNLKIAFFYDPKWGMDLAAHPSKGDVMTSRNANNMEGYLSFFCINVFHFTYDVNYPIKVMIRDDDSFEGRGYTFNFAFPVTVLSNTGDKTVRGERAFDSFDTTAGFCDSLGKEEYSIYVSGAYDGDYDVELKDVNITYNCFSEKCSIGSTKADGGHYRLKTKLPSGCVNPFITASKEGYLDATGQLVDERIDLEMKSITELDFEVVKHLYYGIDNKLQSAQSLEKNETIAISLRLKDELVNFEEYEHYPLIYPDEKIRFIEDNAEYELDVILTKYDDFVGGYKNSNFTVKYSEIAGASKVIFHVFEYRPTPVEGNQLLQNEMITYLMGGTYKSELRPEFI